MSRRLFDHLYAELCVAAGRRASRYDLWLRVWETGGDPEDLTQEALQRFLAEGLDALLREERISLPRRARGRFERAVMDFDPRFPTPEEWVSGLTERPSA